MEVVLIVVVLVILLGAVAAVAVRRRRPEALGTPVETPTEAAVTELPPVGLRRRLEKTRRAIGGRLGGLLGRERLDAEFWSEIEDTLVAADLGVATATAVVDRVRDSAPADGEAARLALERELVDVLEGKDRELHLVGKPAVILVVGVNGTGKTTSIAKLAAQLQARGMSVLLGAADTFRAAADEQLKEWASRVGVDTVAGGSGADPASVAYDAYHAAKARGADVVLIDTAGRLQTKANLMDELAKIARVVRREAGEIGEVLLVLDGTTGQNAIAQAKSFAEAVGVTGIVLTKLDGTAKGGVAVAVEEELGIPVKFIGVGEGIDDLVPFRPGEFVDALLGA